MQHSNGPEREEPETGTERDPDAEVSFVSEFRDYLKERKRWWLLPLFVLLLLIGALLALAAQHAVVAPFIYTLF